MTYLSRIARRLAARPARALTALSASLAAKGESPVDKGITYRGPMVFRGGRRAIVEVLEASLMDH
jgi:hypothetical protein